MGKTNSNDPFGFPRANLKVNCIDFRFCRVDGHLRQQSAPVLNFLSLWYTKHIPISMQLSSRTAHGHRLQTKSHVPTRRISWHQRHALPRKTGLKPPNRLMRKTIRRHFSTAGDTMSANSLAAARPRCIYIVVGTIPYENEHTCFYLLFKRALKQFVLYTETRFHIANAPIRTGRNAYGTRS